MIQGGQNLGFALEAREALGIGGDGLGQHLDRHLAAELRVLGPIDLPHTAFAQLGGDPEMRQRLADQTVDILARTVSLYSLPSQPH